MATKQRTKDGNFTPGDSHKTAFRMVPETEDYVDAFGKIVDPAPVADLPDGQHLAVIFGFRHRGSCTRLQTPQHVTLRSPDGPADGCGFDPSQFLVWKNLGRNQITAHLTTRMVPLHQALMSATDPAASDAIPTLDDVLHIWLPNAQGQEIPSEDQLATAWAQFGSGGPYKDPIAQRLAGLINKFFFSPPTIAASDLPGDMKVSDLRDALHLSA